MYICTYKLPGRKKSFTAPTIPAAHKLFLKDYGLNFNLVKGKKLRRLSYGELLNRDYYRGRFVSFSKKNKSIGVFAFSVIK